MGCKLWRENQQIECKLSALHLQSTGRWQSITRCQLLLRTLWQLSGFLEVDFTWDFSDELFFLVLFTWSSQSIKMGIRQVIFVDWYWKSVKLDKLNCCVKSALLTFHDFNYYNGSPPLFFFGISQIVQLRKHIHGDRLSCLLRNNYSANMEKRNVETITNTSFSLRKVLWAQKAKYKILY